MAEDLIIRCPNCGFEGEGDLGTDGNPGVGCALMWLFLIPGIIYFLWNSSTIHARCSACGSHHVVITDGQVGVSNRVGLAVALVGAIVGLAGLLLIFFLFQDKFLLWMM